MSSGIDGKIAQHIGALLRLCAHARGFGTIPYAAIVVALGLTVPADTRAADQSAHGGWDVEGEAVQRVVVTLNKSRTLRFGKAFATAVMGSPEIADVLPMSDHLLYIQAKKVGTTNLSVFDQGAKLVSLIDIEVEIDTKNLQEKIRWSTGSRGIRVSSTNGQVVLSGLANTAVAADHAMSIVKSFVPNAVNAMTIAPSQQVMLEVRFFEASRDAARFLGINWTATNPSKTRGFNIGQGQVTPQLQSGGIVTFDAAGTLAGSAAQPFGVILAQLLSSGGNNINVAVNALESQGLLRRLAEPNLMALSGDTAQFLAGGEFPVPIAVSSPGFGVTPTIVYKPFGVRLTFTPTVLANGIINLKINPEVSEIDFSNAVTISGTTIPSVNKRDAKTVVELRDGQSFAIAGLLQADNLRNREQIPWLGSVPVLGTLFSSSGYQKHETDLVIIVTPRLVQPVGPRERIATPLEERISSNDPDFFLMGKLEVPKNYSRYVTPRGDIGGPYGHILSVEPGPNETAITR
jgi:pilus assembly protein CpaC